MKIRIDPPAVMKIPVNKRETQLPLFSSLSIGFVQFQTRRKQEQKKTFKSNSNVPKPGIIRQFKPQDGRERMIVFLF